MCLFETLRPTIFHVIQLSISVYTHYKYRARPWSASQHNTLPCISIDKT